MTPRSHVFGYPVPAWQTWLMPALLSIVLVVVEQYSFLLFHLAAELFAVIVCFVLFSVAWSTYRFSKDAFLIFLACGFFWIGVLDLAHTLTYKGMNLFPMPGGNTATQIWIASRYFQALLLLASPFAARVQFDKTLLFFVFGLIAVLIMVDQEYCTAEQALLTWLVLPDGSTVGEWMGPRLDEVYRRGQVPALLPGTGERV